MKNDAGKYVPRAQESKSGSHNRYLFGENLALTAEGVAALVKNNGNASQRVVYTRVYHCHNRSMNLCSWEMEEQRSLADIEQRGLSLTFRGIHSCPELTTWRNDVAAGKEPPSLTPRTRQVRRVAASNDPPPSLTRLATKTENPLIAFLWHCMCVSMCVCVSHMCVRVCARASLQQMASHLAVEGNTPKQVADFLASKGVEIDDMPSAKQVANAATFQRTQQRTGADGSEDLMNAVRKIVTPQAGDDLANWKVIEFKVATARDEGWTWHASQPASTHQPYNAVL